MWPPGRPAGQRLVDQGAGRRAARWAPAATRSRASHGGSAVVSCNATVRATLVNVPARAWFVICWFCHGGARRVARDLRALRHLTRRDWAGPRPRFRVAARRFPSCWRASDSSPESLTRDFRVADGRPCVCLCFRVVGLSGLPDFSFDHCLICTAKVRPCHARYCCP